MSAGLVQLVARGPQDAILTGNPQITFFKQRIGSNNTETAPGQDGSVQIKFPPRVLDEPL